MGKRSGRRSKRRISDNEEGQWPNTPQEQVKHFRKRASELIADAREATDASVCKALLSAAKHYRVMADELHHLPKAGLGKRM